MGFINFKILGISIFVLILFFLSSFNSKPAQEREIEVVLRMIGHEVLLSSKDSTSRVLPILKEGDRYRIQFESAFEFVPEDLVTTIDKVVKETQLAESYIVEVEACDSNEVIYSFKMEAVAKSDIIPCRSRVQEMACYSLLFTFMEPIPMEPERNIWNYLFMGLLLLVVILGFVFLRKKRTRYATDPNLIKLGKYRFDKRNAELIIEEQRIELTSKEADLLLLLYNTANKTVERDVILNRVWGDEGDYIGRTLDVFISKLRKKLEFDAKVKIVNIRGVGYKLVMDK